MMIRNRLPSLLCQLCGPMLRSSRAITNLSSYHSHYDTLEVNPECTKTEIREAWLRLSMLYHPDLNKGEEKEEASRRFQEVKEAYKILIDEKSRNDYDDKIGYKKADPPPDFKKEWTLKGEQNRIKADIYKYVWDEEKIRKLMTSERLREVDWNKQTPAERHKILLEEEQKQAVASDELSKAKTPTLQEGLDSYFAMIAICLVLNYVLQSMKNNDDTEIQEARQTLREVFTENGTRISARARETPPNPESTRRSQLPVITEKMWLENGKIESTE